MSDDHQVGPPDAASRPEPTNRRRLPPPAFPPGSRRVDVRRSLGRKQSEAAPEIEEERVASFDPTEDEATGMDGDAHLDAGELALGGDNHVRELQQQVEQLAEALRHKGEAGLHATPDMSRFEATLRAYCVGYLAGRRAEDPQGV